MTVQESIKSDIRRYILEASLTNKDEIGDATLIFDVGLLDSMGLLFLIEYINEKHKIEVNEEELNPENFESIDSIAAFIESKF